MVLARISTDELPRLERDRFLELFGGVFEHAPWVAEAAFDAGPFHGIEAPSPAARLLVSLWYKKDACGFPGMTRIMPAL